eukprot:1188869-Alexandrium_andersonii.AAC.1
MSASLVGSEMCIRDRDIKAWLGTESGLDKDRSGTERGLLHDSVGIESVSYTHLTLPTICSV